MKRTSPLPLFLTALLLLLPLLCSAQESDIQQLIQAAREETANGSSPGQALARWLRADDAIQKSNQPPMIEVAMAIANIYQSEELYEEALPYYIQAWQSIPANENLNSTSINLYEQLGETYAQIAKPDSAYFFYNLLYEKYEKNENKNGQLAVLQKIVNSYAVNDSHAMALQYNLQLKGLVEQQNRPDQEKMRIYNNLGYTYNQLKLYEQAILFFEQAKEFLHKENREERVIMDVNIGIAYYNLGKFDESIEFLREAQKNKRKYDPKGIDEIEHLISTVYFRKKDLYNALLFSDESTQLALKNNNDALLTDIYYTSALIHSELYEYDLALEYFQKHLRLRDSFELEERFRRQQLLQQKLDLERSEKQTKLRISNEELQKLTIEQLQTEKEKQQLEIDKQTALLATQEKEKELLLKDNDLKASKIQTQELETERAKQELELARQRLLASEEAQKVAVLEKDNKLNQLALARSADSLAAEQKERQLISKEKELTDLALQQQNERVQSFYRFAILGGLITLLILGGFLYSRKLNRQLNQKNAAIEQQKEEISLERNKSDQLLLNILPAETAQELKEHGTAVPKRYDNATVLFTDFSGFTRIASGMSPEQLIEELNYCFRHFDTILEKYGLEKIKTIGDAYMCVAGVPSPLQQHATRSIQAGQEIVQFMNQRIKEKQEAGQEYWNMRMGIHSGPVVAGVVGKKKFAYDIWGDTVNVASRMESNGEVGRINISEATYELVKSEFDCEHRGKIYAKNVGEVSMYFVKG